MAIKRYLKIYTSVFKISMAQSTTYRLSFFIEILVELGYCLILIIFFKVLYSNVHEIAGWSYDEVLFLNGLNIVTSETILGGLFIFGLWSLPRRIKDGEIDNMLTKPMNSLIALTLLNPYFTSFIATIPGFYLMGYVLMKTPIVIEFRNVIYASAVFVCGLVIAYSISVILSSLTFVLTNANTLPRIADDIITHYKQNPHSVYQGKLRTIFFYLVPIIYISSVPTSLLLKQADPGFLFSAVLIASVFLFMTIKIWNSMLRHYSSASS